MLSINVSELVLTVINFFLLVFLLNKFLYKPLISFMDERDARIANAKKLKDAALQEQQQSEAALEERREQSREQARKLISDNKAENDRARSAAIAQAHKQELEARKEIKAGVCREKEELKAELKNGEAELAALLAEQLLR